MPKRTAATLKIRDEVTALKRERTLGAAVDLFYEKGYENTTLDEVAERLGVTKPFAIGSIHTFHDSEIFEPIPVGAKVRITAKAIDKFVKRERRYVRHEITVADVSDDRLYFREIRDILSR